MRYTLRQLEIFIAVARHESVSRAADALALSQSATSTALGELERQFDTQLFDRIGKALRLNEAGHVLLPHAVQLIEHAREIESMLARQTDFGPLQIGATLTVGNYLATLIAADFLRRHPSARVGLSVHNSATIMHQLLHYELDLGLIEGSCRHPDLLVEPWVEDELVVFCAPGHPLAHGRPVEMTELAAQDWILREAGSGTRETFDQALRHFSGELRVRLELEHTEAIKRAVESGLGIGCISRLALREAFRRGSLKSVGTPGLDLRRQFQFVTHRRKHVTAGMREFIALCRQMTAGAARSDLIELPFIP
ncbi:MAG: LysR family transcriptional regulator [Zoogloea sp.]|uniref:LysR family transcriptional regulator n=1 Tax=Zoogloea sp. TaxID=49181 RepID=UPI002627E263|nr:LysR family transcriptional regulator [Zoogloea sp.]MDD3325537.1 LysR family transcriptional regulator [Zoogloea sp.]